MSREATHVFIGIAVFVAIWLAPLVLGAWTFRRKGYSPHWTWFGIVPIVGMVVLCVAILLPSRMPALDGPVTTPYSRLPSGLVVPVAAFSCAWLGGMSFGDGRFSLVPPSPPSIIGGCIGLLLGLAVYLDHRSVERRIEQAAPAAAPEPDAVATPAAVSDPRSNAIAVLMLSIPLIAGLLIWQQEMMQLSTRTVRLLGSATILSTALLGYCDMRQLALRTRGIVPSASQIMSPSLAAFMGILGLWLLAYPVHFLARCRFGAKNLIIPALMVTAVFLAPTVRAWFSEATLPSVDSPDVLALVAEMIEANPMHQARRDVLGKVHVRQPAEISFDQGKQRRVARAKLVSQHAEEDVFYSIEWLDRQKGIFSVQVYDTLP